MALEKALWLVAEKMPLLLLAFLSSRITYLAQVAGASMAKWTQLPLELRLSNVLTGYCRYIGGMIWPFKLAAFYPYEMNPDPLWVVLAAGLLILITYAVVVGAFFGRRYLAVGWFWFLGTMVPVIGLVQVGDQSMADRYSYFTFTGLFIIVVWGAADLLGRWSEGRLGLAVATVALLAGYVYLTQVQVGYWKNAETSLRHTLDVEPDSPAFENNLGVYLWEKAEGARAPGRPPKRRRKTSATGPLRIGARR